MRRIANSKPEEAWWWHISDDELSYLLFHLAGEVTNRDDFNMTHQLKTRLLLVATETWRSIACEG